MLGIEIAILVKRSKVGEPDRGGNSDQKAAAR